MIEGISDQPSWKHTPCLVVVSGDIPCQRGLPGYEECRLEQWERRPASCEAIRLPIRALCLSNDMSGGSVWWTIYTNYYVRSCGHIQCNPFN